MKLQADDRPVSNEDREWQARAARLVVESLDNIRVVAGRWAATIGSLTGVLGLAALVGGPRSVDHLDGVWRVLTGVVVLLAIVAAGWATWSAAGAAQGRVGTTLSTYARLRDHVRDEEARARRLLNRSKAFSMVALAALIVALGISWFAPRDHDEMLVIRRGDTVHCVPLNGNVTLSLQIDGTSTVTVDKSCPSK